MDTTNSSTLSSYYSTGFANKLTEYAESPSFSKRHIVSRVSVITHPIFNTLDFLEGVLDTAISFSGTLFKNTLRFVWLKSLANKLPNTWSFEKTGENIRKTAFFALTFFAGPVLTLLNPSWCSRWYAKQGVVTVVKAEAKPLSKSKPVSKAKKKQKNPSKEAASNTKPVQAPASPVSAHHTGDPKENPFAVSDEGSIQGDGDDSSWFSSQDEEAAPEPKGPPKTPPLKPSHPPQHPSLSSLPKACGAVVDVHSDSSDDEDDDNEGVVTFSYGGDGSGTGSSSLFAIQGSLSPKSASSSRPLSPASTSASSATSAAQSSDHPRKRVKVRKKTRSRSSKAKVNKGSSPGLKISLQSEISHLLGGKAGRINLGELTEGSLPTDKDAKKKALSEAYDALKYMKTLRGKHQIRKESKRKKNPTEKEKIYIAIKAGLDARVSQLTKLSVA